MDFIRPFFEGKHWIVQILCLLLFVIVGIIVFSGLGYLVDYLAFKTMDMNEAANPAAFVRISQTFASIGVFLVPSLLFAFCNDKKWLHYNAADRKPHYLLVNVTLLLSIVILPLVAGLAGWNQSLHLPDSLYKVERWMVNMEEQADYILRLMTFDHTYGTLMANIIVMAVVPAVCEEFLFQGTIQRFMHKRNWNPHLCIWLTGFIFSTIHLEFFGFVPRFLLGVYLGYLYYWSRSLWLPILAHFLHNALSLLVTFTLEGRGVLVDDMKITDIHGSNIMLLTCTLVTAMSLVFMWKVQKEFNQTEWE